MITEVTEECDIIQAKTVKKIEDGILGDAFTEKWAKKVAGKRKGK